VGHSSSLSARVRRTCKFSHAGVVFGWKTQVGSEESTEPIVEPLSMVPFI
jgi:hypothetical protein